MDLKQVKEIIAENNYSILEEKRTGNNLGTVLKIDNGAIINCYDSGKLSFQGKNKETIEPLFAHMTVTNNRNLNRKIFVVYGHDMVARTQLEAMLRRWDMEPLILDQLASSGTTIIEKLEEYTKQVQFGIVLATPDDIGYPKNQENLKKARARQNVVLELGMLLTLLGRSKVAILLSQNEEMERPSDIEGLIYIPFKDNVEETKLSLAKELNAHGFNLDIGKL